MDLPHEHAHRSSHCQRFFCAALPGDPNSNKPFISDFTELNRWFTRASFTPRSYYL